MGEIVAAHALGGMVRMRAYQPPAASVRAGRCVLIEHDGTAREARIRSAAPHGQGLLLVAFEGVTDRTAAEALVGGRILVPIAELPPPDEGEFYYHEVAGFDVETIAGERIGTIRETFFTGVNDVWVVERGAREHLVPVIADVVRTIDRSARRVVIEPMPGLLD